MKDKALRKALKAMRTATALAKQLKISPEAVMQWRRVPPRHVIAVERLTGVPRHELRPDFYPREGRS